METPGTARTPGLKPRTPLSSWSRGGHKRGYGRQGGGIAERKRGNSLSNPGFGQEWKRQEGRRWNSAQGLPVAWGLGEVRTSEASPTDIRSYFPLFSQSGD